MFETHEIIPLYSIFSLITEIGVSVSIFYIIYQAYHSGVFLKYFAYGVLAYEALFNISYMLSRVIEHAPDKVQAVEGAFEIGLAIFHGIFSIIMFLALVGFFLYAARIYARSENYFRMHPILTRVFVLAWTLSIASGIMFFVELYLI